MTPTPAGREALDALLAARCPDAVDLDGWRRIDLAEQALGRAADRPRAKIVDPGSNWPLPARDGQNPRGALFLNRERDGRARARRQ